jgi:hypothetical protein
LGESGADGLAGLSGGGVLQDGFGRAWVEAFQVDDGIAAVEDGKWGERVEAEGGAFEAGAARGSDSLGDGGEAGFRGFEAPPDVGDADCGVVAAEAGFEGGKAGGVVPLQAGVGVIEPEAQLVDALLAPADGVAEAGEDLFSGEALQALAGAQEVVFGGAKDAAFERGYALFDAVLGGGDQLGGG